MTTAAARQTEAGWVRNLKRLRRSIWRLFGWVVIGSAVLVGFGRLLAPYADHARPVVEQLLAERIGQPVRIERLVASWPRFSPVFEIEGLSIGRETEPGLQIERSRLEIRLYKLVRPAQNTLELVAIGLELRLLQQPSGRWTWQLDQGGRVAGDWQRSLAAGDLVLRDSRVRVVPRALTPFELDVPEARLRRSGSELEIWLGAHPVDAPVDRIEARFRLTQGSDGLEAVRAYGFAPRLRPWLPEPGASGSRLQLWFDWNRSQGARLHARGQIELPGSNGGAETSDVLTVDGNWQNDRLAVEVNAGPAGDGAGGPIDRLAVAVENGSLGIEARYLELDYLHALATPWLAGRFAFWPTRLEGTARELRMGWSPDSGLFRLAGRADDIGLALAGSDLALDGLDLSLGLAGDRPSLELAGSVRAAIPVLYQDPIQLERIGGRVELMPGGARLAAVQIDHREFELQVDGDLMLDDQGPFVDLNVAVARLTPTDPRRWLPLAGIGPNTRRWLEQALVELDHARAETVLFGRLVNWRQGIPPGAFESHVAFRGLTLDYAKDWPPARETRGEVVFLGESLQARVDRSDVAGQGLRAPNVRIRRFRAAEVELELESLGGEAAALATLTRSFPLEAARSALAAMEWSGAASATARLWLPLRRLREWRLTGSVELDGARMILPTPEIAVNAIHGRVPFTRDRFGPSDILAELGASAVQARLDATLTPEFELHIDGTFAPVGLLPGAWRRRLPELDEAVRGRSEISIRIGRDSDAYGEGLRLDVASELEGIEIDLPAPMRKSADQPWSLQLAVPLGDDSIPVRFDLDPLGSGLILGDSRAFQMGLAFGDAAPRLPMAEAFLVEGRVDQLDLVGWIQLLGRATAAEPGFAEDIGDASGWLRLGVGELLVGERSLGALELALERELSYWRFHARGERMDGSVRLPAGPGAEGDLVADFDRLHWPGVTADDNPVPAAPATFDPARMPALDLVIRQMRWGELDLGMVRAASHHSDAGLEIERISATGPGLEVSGSGRWASEAAPDDLPLTWMNLRMISSDLGLHLRQAGFDLALERGSAAVEFAGRWPGSPVDFTLRRVSGTLGIRIEDGSIPAARPGAGRLLGLVSLNSIPRRLRLDFSDVFGDGLGFDRISGDFVLTDGIAQTDTLKIEAPSAEIRISGLTDLGQQTYDQRVTVRPGLSATLPVIGALAGGPIGAAAGAALQQILSRPLQGMSEVRYSVTGSWDEPKIEPLRSDAPAGGS